MSNASSRGRGLGPVRPSLPRRSPGIENLPYLSGQLPGHERLRYVVDPLVQPPGVNDCIPRIPGHIEDGQARPQGAGRAGKFVSLQTSGQNYVGEQEIYLRVSFS